jgi:anthranilate phosphoribosyltransferase
MAPIIAGVFADRGRAAAVFRGDDGLDELTLATTSTLWWVREGSVTTYSLGAGDVGLESAPLEALRGGEASYNAQVARDLLDGVRGPVRDAVLLNAGMAARGRSARDRDRGGRGGRRPRPYAAGPLGGGFEPGPLRLRR